MFTTKVSHLPIQKVVYFGVLLALLVSAFLPGVVFADSPPKETYFICPSVSTHNDNGKWVIGTHGAYYVVIPTKGGTNNDSKVYLTIPVSVPNLAQIPAGWGLYNDLPFYPNFEGMAVLLAEGISNWLGSPAGWEEFDMAQVVNNGDGTFTVINLTRGGSVTISQPIPMASAAAW